MKSETLTSNRLVHLVVISLLSIFFSTSCTDKDPGWLTFSTPGTVATDCTDGLAIIEITASGGNKPYIFYVIPEEQWYAGDNMGDMLRQNNFTVLYRYAHEKNKIEVKGGTLDQPRNYWVTVQDITGNGTVGGTNLSSWWKKVEVACHNRPGE